MDLTAWIAQCRRDYRQRDDRARQRLVALFDRAFEVRETEPQRAVGLFEEGRDLARDLDEPWWRMFYDKLRLDGLMHFARDYRHVLEDASRNVLELRKSAYAGFPARFGVYDTLLAAYLGIDAVGNAEAIEELCETIDREMPPKPTVDRHLYLARKRIFQVERRNWDDANAAALLELDLIHANPDTKTAEHFAVFTYCALCQITHQRRNWIQLAEYIELGLETARKVGHRCELAELEAWKAVASRYAGQDEAAARTLAEAEKHLEGVRMPPKFGFFAALAAYHEPRKEYLEMLHADDRELSTLTDRGQLLDECRVRIERCKVLVNLDRMTEDDLVTTRAAAQRLRFPEPYLQEIDFIEQPQ